MTVKQVFAPHLGRHVKLGRNRPTKQLPALRLAKYLKPSLPAPPPSLDYTPKAMQSLSALLKNDVLGDCVIACGYHSVGLWTGNAGSCFVPTDDQIIADYSAIGGYVPGDESTDNGCEIPNALEYWRTTGFADGSKLVGSLIIDACNPDEWKQALYLFEAEILGMELPDPWVQNMPNASGFTWDAAGDPDPSNGHCVGAGGYDTSNNMKIITWGMIGWLTPAAQAAYLMSKAGGELHVALSPDQIAKGQAKAPNGLDWVALNADFKSLPHAA